MKLPELPWWIRGPGLTAIHNAAQQFWAGLYALIPGIKAQAYPDTCDADLLPLIAWQRGVERFPAEPEAQYRLRIKHAFANAMDAGSTAGFSRIFARLALGAVEQEEGHPDRDADVIVMKVTGQAACAHPDMLPWLIRTYGRTCRRYEWSFAAPVTLAVKTALYSCDTQTFKAVSLPVPAGDRNAQGNGDAGYS